MSAPSNRRRIAEALDIQWTPALAARTHRRITAAITQRHRRRRAAAVGLALLALGGVSFAFVRGRELFRRPGPPVAAPISEAKAPAAETSAPPASDDSAPMRVGPPAEGTNPARHRRLAFRPRSAPAPAPTVSSLFAAADAARVAGRSAEAVAPLTAILDRFPGDPRAALAAFELGRVLADDLHDPAAAARAFARAHDLDPGGPLAGAAAGRARESEQAGREGATP